MLNARRWLRHANTICLFLVPLLVGSCTSVPVAPEAARQEALSGALPAAKAGIYFIRASGVVGSAGCFYADLDGQYWGALGNGQYFYEFVSPGQHVFSRSGAHNLVVETEAGKNYYVAVSVANLKLLPEAEGRADTQKLAFNPDRWYMRLYNSNWPLVRPGMSSGEVANLLPFLLLPQHIGSYGVTAGARFTASSGRYLYDHVVIENNDSTITATFTNGFWKTTLVFRNDILTSKLGPEPGINKELCNGPPY